MSEAKVIDEFIAWVKEAHQNCKVQKEITVGEMRIDVKIIEVNEQGIVKDIICYFEAKGEDADLRDLGTGYFQALYVGEQTKRDVWFILRDKSEELWKNAKLKPVAGIQIFNIDQKELHQTESVADRMKKGRMTKAQEGTTTTWSKNFAIETTSPIAITTNGAQFDSEGNLLFNLGARMRGVLKEILKTVRPSMAEKAKHSIYVEPLEIALAHKSELRQIADFIPTKTGSGKREFYEVSKGKRLNFTVRCIGSQYTPELIEDMIIQGGTFCGIGDSHSDGFHGRYVLVQ